MAAQPVLPSAEYSASAPRTICFTTLHSTARTHRYRRFAPALADSGARLAENATQLRSFVQGTCTLYLSAS